jgi:hypothetical protein
MPDKDQYVRNATIVVAALFPQWTDEAKAALVWLIVDALLSLDGIATER